MSLEPARLEEDAMGSIEQIPTTWDAGRDEQFFRIVAGVLPCDLVDGASSLLGTYDADDVAPPQLVL
jgi:hypothetical protein